MRTITDKDRAGLTAALRTLIQNGGLTRLSTARGSKLIDRALQAGLTADILLNPSNRERYVKDHPHDGAEAYVEHLITHPDGARAMKEEKGWNTDETGFTVVAEAAHAFFSAVTGRGGQWSTLSARKNLSLALHAHTLQGILSEELIEEVKSRTGGTPFTYFSYILAVSQDFGALSIDDSLTKEQEERRLRITSTGVREHSHTEEKEQGRVEVIEETSHTIMETAESPSPEGELEVPEDCIYPEHFEGERFETVFVTENGPREMKRENIQAVIRNYSLDELGSLLDTIEGGRSLPMSEAIEKLTDGLFDTAMETPAAREVHQQISADLIGGFIETVRYQGLEMDAGTASGYDTLKDSWDLRSPAIRKLHKLRKLIVTYGKDDPDLTDAIPDIEKLYGNTGIS